MDTLRIALENGTFPHRLQYSPSLPVADPFYEVLDQFHVLALGGEDGCEFLIGCLEQTECRVERAVDDLNVFQTLLLRGRVYCALMPASRMILVQRTVSDAIRALA